MDAVAASEGRGEWASQMPRCICAMELSVELLAGEHAASTKRRHGIGRWVVSILCSSFLGASPWHSASGQTHHM